jgi:hypothetical protein
MQIDGFPPYWPELLIGGILLMILGAMVYSWRKRRPSAAEVERRRRELIASIGKVGDGTITEVQDGLISYNYHVRGIEYTTSQDISALESHMTTDSGVMLGPSSVKYDPRNPANSIVVSEQWNGIRKTSTKLER